MKNREYQKERIHLYDEKHQKRIVEPKSSDIFVHDNKNENDNFNPIVHQNENENVNYFMNENWIRTKFIC